MKLDLALQKILEVGTFLNNFLGPVANLVTIIGFIFVVWALLRQRHVRQYDTANKVQIWLEEEYLCLANDTGQSIYAVLPFLEERTDMSAHKVKRKALIPEYKREIHPDDVGLMNIAVVNGVRSRFIDTSGLKINKSDTPLETFVQPTVPPGLSMVHIDKNSLAYAESVIKAVAYTLSDGSSWVRRAGKLKKLRQASLLYPTLGFKAYRDIKRGSQQAVMFRNVERNKY